MKNKAGSYCIIIILILIITNLSIVVTAQQTEEIEVTGVTVYRAYPFRYSGIYGIKKIFFKNYSYANFSIDIPWSTPFSFDSLQQTKILEKIINNSLVDQNSINMFSRSEFSMNEYIDFTFVGNPSYRCVIFPTMLIGIGTLTETNEYIGVSEMNKRRNGFLSFFENFIMQKPGFQFNLQQEEFLTGESLPRESMVWTRIIRVTPNFNYFSNDQLIDFLYFKTFNYEKIVNDDKTKMVLSSNFYNHYINEVILFDGFKLSSWKTYYNYPLGLNENIIRLHTLSELSYILLPYSLDELYSLQNGLDTLEINLTSLNDKIKEMNYFQKLLDAGCNEIKNSRLYEELISNKIIFRELQKLDITMKLRNKNSIFESLFESQLNNQYGGLSIYLDDISTQYYSVKDYYDSMLGFAYTDSASAKQSLALLATLVILIFTVVTSFWRVKSLIKKISEVIIIIPQRNYPEYIGGMHTLIEEVGNKFPIILRNTDIESVAIEQFKTVLEGKKDGRPKSVSYSSSERLPIYLKGKEQKEIDIKRDLLELKKNFVISNEIKGGKIFAEIPTKKDGKISIVQFMGQKFKLHIYAKYGKKEAELENIPFFIVEKFGPKEKNKGHKKEKNE